MTSEGNYSAVILVSYEDNNNVVNTVTRQVQYNVFELKVEQTPQGPLENIMGYITNYRSPQFILILIIILVIIISISILVRKRRSKLEEFEL